MSTFGEVTYQQDDPQKLAGAGSANGASDAPLEILDENDPRLNSEDLDVNVKGDAFAMPAPPPEGIKLRLRLKLLKQKDASGKESDFLIKTDKQGGLYMATGVEGTIVDPTNKYEGMKVFDRWVGTFRNRDNSTKVTTILSKCKQPSGQPWIPAANDPNYPRSHASWMKLFLRFLAGEPEVLFEPQWEWSCPKCGEEVKKARGAGQDVDYKKSVTGMSHFAVDKEASRREGRTVYDPSMECPQHGWSRAQVRIGQVYSVDQGGAPVAAAAGR